MTVVVRFAPSPTGSLHIGSARTALFNWLFALHYGGHFLLRIEDTDRVRSTEAAIAAIFDGLNWLGLQPFGGAEILGGGGGRGMAKPVFQFARTERHREVARELVAQGMAYPCWTTPAELEAMRAALPKREMFRYPGTWRDRAATEAPAGIAPVIRLKMPQTGETRLDDLVGGSDVRPNSEIDDLIIVRADGTPTYNLAVVVDDHDMGVTHVIRGDDHATNTFKQVALYRAMGWDVPQFGHIPMIFGPDGKKMSKRHGAVGIAEYREMGYLPEAMKNYLLRLGWGHGDDEIISMDQAIEWFDLDGVGRSPSRFDFKKLDSVNAHYLRTMPQAELILDLVADFLPQRLGRKVSDPEIIRLVTGIGALKERAKTLVELADGALIYCGDRPLAMTAAAAAILTPDAKRLLAGLKTALDQTVWTSSELEAKASAEAERHDLKLGQIAQPLRAALTGRTISPPIFDVMAILGREESLARLGDIL
jgi:glutamyl-tRNA synthetase